MRGKLIRIVLGAVLTTTFVVGCSQAPAPAPTAAPKAAEATKAPAQPTAAPAQPTAAPAQPTAAPAKKVDWPQKGKPITLIVPYAAGGSTDIAGRALGAGLESQLGTGIQVVNKAGAATQIALTDLSQTAPDGYTIGYTVLPTALTTYLQPDNKAVYTAKSFQPLAIHFMTPSVAAVQADSPYKTMADVVDAAKAKPGQIKVGVSGKLTTLHLAALEWQRLAGVKFAIVIFDGDAPAMTALLGGHVDVAELGVPTTVQGVQNKQVRALAVNDALPSASLPGVKTATEQGYKLNWVSIGGVSAPANVSKDVVDILSGAIKKVMETADHKKKLEDLGFTVRYQGPQEFATMWQGMEAQVKTLLPLANQ